MTITGLSGAIGSGKSLKQLAYGLEQCNMKKRQLVTNFSLNYRELRKYAKLKKLGWVAYMVDRGLITVVDAANNLGEIMSRPNSIVLLDEAGIFLNSREFSKTPKRLLADLCQSRKDGCDLIWASQFDEQVDRQFRLLTQYWIHCSGWSKWDKQLNRPRLWIKNYHFFRACDFERWNTSTKAKSSYLKTRFAFAFHTETWFLDKADRQLFKCFDSFARLDKQAANTVKATVDSFSYCNLTPEYYWQLLGDQYDPINDPTSPRYQRIVVEHKPVHWQPLPGGIQVASKTKPDEQPGCHSAGSPVGWREAAGQTKKEQSEAIEFLNRVIAS